MKTDAEILMDAARMVRAGKAQFSCCAVSRAEEKSNGIEYSMMSPVRLRYIGLTSPSGYLDSHEFGAPWSAANQAHRVMNLIMAATIAADEDRAK